jgi:hypothetical protein
MKYRDNQHLRKLAEILSDTTRNRAERRAAYEAAVAAVTGYPSMKQRHPGLVTPVLKSDLPCYDWGSKNCRPN